MTNLTLNEKTAFIIGNGLSRKDFDLNKIMTFGHYFEAICILIVAGTILLPGIFRMFWLSIIKEKMKVPIHLYIKKIWHLFIHMFTQMKGLKCASDTFRWVAHFFVIFGYLVFLFVTVFLGWFESDNDIIIYVGYIVSGIVTFFSSFFILARIAKKKEITKFSHISDWFFVLWLFLIGLTGLLVRIFIDLELLNDYIWIYMLHLIILSQWAVILVPFGKWTHFLYRPFAVYFSELKKSAGTLKVEG